MFSYPDFVAAFVKSVIAIRVIFDIKIDVLNTCNTTAHTATIQLCSATLRGFHQKEKGWEDQETVGIEEYWKK